MQALLRLIYPSRCALCDTEIEEEHALCPACWRDTPFLRGLCCDKCGAPLPGEEVGGALCDDCLRIARPWDRGRAALLYSGAARQLVLALKHGDRTDLALPAARWMQAAGTALLRDDTLIVPVPVHRFRLLKRRYNQAALLGRALARISGVPHLPDALTRIRRTPKQDGMTVTERFENMQGAISVNAARTAELRGRSILLVDDVMTSGATLAAAADACHATGANRVSILILARVVKDA